MNWQNELPQMERLYAWSGTSSDRMAAYPSLLVLAEKWESLCQSIQLPSKQSGLDLKELSQEMKIVLTKLLGIPGIIVEESQEVENTIILTVKASTKKAICPRCGQTSYRLHQNKYHLVISNECIDKYNNLDFLNEILVKTYQKINAKKT